MSGCARAPIAPEVPPDRLLERACSPDRSIGRAEGSVWIRAESDEKSGVFPALVRAGIETAEWAWDRADVRARVRHELAPVLESWPASGGFPGHRYHAILRLPGRFRVDGIRLERLPGAGRFTLSRMALVDTASGRFTPVSLAAGYLSDGARFRELAATPSVRLFELPQNVHSLVPASKRCQR